MTRASTSPSHWLLVVLLALSCATAARSPIERGAVRAESESASARDLAAGGFHAWLYRDDATAAAVRFAAALKRDPRDPWARLGAAWAARRVLDDAAESDHLLALATGAPSHPLARVALRRLGELAELAPPLAQAVESGLAPALAAGKLRGLAAYRARVARAASAEARGDYELAARVRAENGAVTAWTLVGPCGAYHALDMDRPFPPESGALRCNAPPGISAVEARELSFPEGTAALDGEPATGDIYYLVADVRIARGGRYIVAVGSTAALEASLEGEPLAERRSFETFPPLVQFVPRELRAGSYRLLLKMGRGASAASAAAAFAREDGAPSDAIASAATGERSFARPARSRRLPETTGTALQLEQVLEPEAGPVLARLVAARDQVDGNREAAKVLLDEAAALLPQATPILAAVGDARRDDPTLADRVARARAEAAYDQALARDPGDAEVRLSRAELMRAGERSEDAQALLASLPEPQASQPRALLMRARVAWARGFAEGAERLATEARRRGGHCQALEILYELSTRRDALARSDELAQALAFCPGGRERLAGHRRLRGDAAGAVAALAPLVGFFPARVDLRLTLARALVARGDPRAAAEEVGAVARLWPRDARLEKRRAELLELAGDAAAARRARERALRLDGTDLGLRRALALEDGREILAEYAEDGREAIRAWKGKGLRPQTSSAFVLDTAAVLANPDGSSTERIHQVIQVLDQRGVERWGEVGLPPGAQVLELRTLKADGRVLEPEDGGEKRTFSLPGLEPGDCVEYEYLHASAPRGPAVPGFSADPFFFRVEGSPMFRSSYVVAAPAGIGLQVDAHHMESPQIKMEGDREVLRVVRTEVPALVDEPSDPGGQEYLPFLQVGTGAGGEALQSALGDAFVERTRPTVEVATLARSIARPAEGPPPSGEARVRAAYEKVNEVIEGQGGSWAESASQVLSRGRGSRTVLLKAVYRVLGIQARLALVRLFTSDPSPYRFPRPDLYGHAVLRVQDGGKTYWLDPSTRYTPFGQLAAAARGAEVLVLPEPGEAPEVSRTPDDDGPDGRQVNLVGTLGSGGDAVIEGVERYLGFEGAVARAMVERLDAQARRQIAEQSLTRSFRGLTLDSLEIEGERRMDEPLVLRWRVRVPQLARMEAGRAVVDATPFPVQLGARYATLAARETPLLIGSTERFALHVELALPPGLHAAGENREVLTEFGSYRRFEREEGGRLVRDDRFELRRSRIAPGGYPAFARFAKSVDEAQEAPLVLGR